MHLEVCRVFNARISETFQTKPLIKDFLINHERKHIAINNLCEQLKPLKLDLAQFIKVVQSTADLFASTALNAKEIELLTASEQKRRQDEASRMQTLEAEFNEMQKEATTDIIKSYG